MNSRFAVVVPYVDPIQLRRFLGRWDVDSSPPPWLILQHDERREGCGKTKNKGIQRAMHQGAELVIILDDDCMPADKITSLEELVDHHEQALEPQAVKLFDLVTDPPSRGTPYHSDSLSVRLPVAASMGFWEKIGDYCAVRQLSNGAEPMTFRREAIYGRYFPLCGMNLAFRPHDWMPWCRFIDVPRFDDIWMGWLWQREAIRRGACFNLAGPLVEHSRQSNVWNNLRQEASFLEETETLWAKIATSIHSDYESLCKLLPV